MNNLSLNVFLYQCGITGPHQFAYPLSIVSSTGIRYPFYTNILSFYKPSSPTQCPTTSIYYDLEDVLPNWVTSDDIGNSVHMFAVSDYFVNYSGIYIDKPFIGKAFDSRGRLSPDVSVIDNNGDYIDLRIQQNVGFLETKAIRFGSVFCCRRNSYGSGIADQSFTNRQVQNLREKLVYPFVQEFWKKNIYQCHCLEHLFGFRTLPPFDIIQLTSSGYIYHDYNAEIFWIDDPPINHFGYMLGISDGLSIVGSGYGVRFTLDNPITDPYTIVGTGPLYAVLPDLYLAYDGYPLKRINYYVYASGMFIDSRSYLYHTFSQSDFPSSYEIYNV